MLCKLQSSLRLVEEIAMTMKDCRTTFVRDLVNANTQGQTAGQGILKSKTGSFRNIEDPSRNMEDKIAGGCVSTNHQPQESEFKQEQASGYAICVTLYSLRPVV